MLHTILLIFSLFFTYENFFYAIEASVLYHQYFFLYSSYEKSLQLNVRKYVTWVDVAINLRTWSSLLCELINNDATVWCTKNWGLMEKCCKLFHLLESVNLHFIEAFMNIFRPLIWYGLLEKFVMANFYSMDDKIVKTCKQKCFMVIVKIFKLALWYWLIKLKLNLKPEESFVFLNFHLNLIQPTINSRLIFFWIRIEK